MAELRKYGVATTILFPLIDRDAVDFESTPVSFVAADTQISKNEGAFVNTGSTPAHEGNGMYSLALTATEMQAARIMITCIDAATKTWEDQAIIIDTYGNASAEHAFDMDTATQNVNVSTISANAITATAINANAITSAKIATDAIGATQIAANAIGASELADNAITAAKIATDAITANKIASNAITATKISSNAITSAKIQIDAIGASQLAANSIGSSQIANDAITGAKILNGAITAAKISANAITDLQISDNAITAGKLAADAIGSSELATTAVNEIRDAILTDSTSFNGADIATILTNTNGIVAVSASGVADAGSTTTLVDNALTEADTDYWAGSWLRLTSGSSAGQTRLITAFNPGTNTITFFPATTQAVAALDDYQILPAGAVPWNTAWDAEVESEVNDAIDTAISELGVAAPTSTPNLRTGLMLLYMALRNKTVVQTSGTDALEIHNDAGTIIASKLLTDDGSDYTEAEMA